MTKEVHIQITMEDAEIIMKGLMELQAKISLGIIQKLDLQIRPQLEGIK